MLSRPVVRPRHELSPTDRRYLEAVALDTWRYFDRHVTGDHQALPPDNVQLVPELRVARAHLADQHRHEPAGRRSPPTTSASSTSTTLVDRTEATLTTIERLERHQGHLLNWYDTQTLAPLMPPYVSTVDSGNLAGALMCLAAALREYRSSVPRAVAGARRPADAQLADRATALFDGDGLRLPLRPAAAAVRHRLPAAGRRGPGPARSVVLRPAGVGSAPGQLPRHRQGRRAAEPLVPPRPPAHQPSTARRCCCRGARRCSST